MAINRDQKHIALFDHIFYMGGVERVFLNYAEILTSRGYTVDLVLSRVDRSIEALIPNSINVVRLGEGTFRQMPARLRHYIRNSSVSTLIAGNELDNFAAILANQSLPKKERIQIVVSQHSVPNADDADAGLMGRFFPIGKRLLYRKAHKVVAVSRAVAANLEKNGVPKHKITIAHNPVDVKQIEISAQGEPNVALPQTFIVAVGRLHRVKNLGLLIEAFDQIERLDIELIIVGDGPMRTKWEEMAKKSPKSDKIHFVGTVSNSASIIDRAAIVAVPSTSEGFSLVAVEAMALGKTVVYTPNEGCCEVVGMQFGYCADTFDDPRIFADALNQAIECPIDSKLLKSRAAEFDKQRFDLQNLIG